jgi:hypothetical protein
MIKAKDEHQQQQNIAVIRAYLFSTHHKKFFISWCSFPRERLRCAYSKINLLSWSGVAHDPKLSCRFNSKGQRRGDMAGMDAHAHQAWSTFLVMTKSCNCNAASTTLAAHEPRVWSIIARLTSRRRLICPLPAQDAGSV